MSLFVDVEKDFGAFCLSVKLEAENETLALLGASGCGKTMTLKCIAGIERPDRGKIMVDGVTLFDSEKKINLPPQKRRTGLLFQNYALFPHMTVQQNIQAGAGRMRQAQIPELLARFDLTELADRLPRQLSGGQQQRVALARLLASEPNILLLDEPFSALDRHLRGQLEQELRSTLREFGKTVLLVSHDREEVYRMADSVAVLNCGRVEMLGSREQVFFHPETRAAALLTGCDNLSDISLLEDGTVYAGDWGLKLRMEKLPPQITAVAIRAQALKLGGGVNSVRCRVVEEIENPFSCRVLLRPMGVDAAVPLVWEVEKTRWMQLRNTEVELCLPPEQLLPLQDRRNGE